MVRAKVPGIACEPVPELVNFRNGLLDWREGALGEHSPDVLSTVQLAVNWNPGAACPRFEKFLAEVLTPDDIGRMWETIGYLLMPGDPLHKMFLLYGPGFNGKGVLLRVLTALIGRQNVSAVSLHSLASERFARVALFGKLANVCGDIDATRIEQTGLLKQLTGEDLINAEHKFRKSFDFTSWAVPLFSANDIPSSSDTSYGWLRRWEVFRFPNIFPDSPGLESALRQPAGLEGIAVRAVAELRELMERAAFTVTEAGKAAKAEFTAHQDPLWGWFEERCWADPGAWTDQRAAYADYASWVQRSGGKQLGKTRFYKLMRDRFTVTRHNGFPGYAGLRLRPWE
jgi:putative DNA primase/helicase